MRLHFTLSPNTEPVPFDYQHRLTGIFHKWLKENSLHDRISLYSLSWLDGSFARNGSLHFPNGARWFVSFHEEEYAEKLVGGALLQPKIFTRRPITINQKKYLTFEKDNNKEIDSFEVLSDPTTY
jgi:CRISPR/Cas system endoribonuclease Cas6 (RAMP superfamily)